MKFEYTCQWCETPFIAKRTDMKYHTIACRNAANSYQYRRRNMIYKELADASKKVDDILNSKYSKTKNILVRESDFKNLGIDITAAVRTTIDDKNEIVNLRYGYYSLIHESNRIFKLIKN